MCLGELWSYNDHPGRPPSYDDHATMTTILEQKFEKFVFK